MMYLYPMLRKFYLLIVLLFSLLTASSGLYAQELTVREKSELTVFRTEDFALMHHSSLESLLNTLPGVRVDNDGNINRDNDAVEHLLIDGKEVFGEGRRRLALTSIQTYAVEEVWFYKQDGDASKLLDHAMGDDVKVVDIRLKKDYNTGIPLDLKGGVGSGDGLRYKGNLLGLYNDKSTRLFMYGSVDNLNEDELMRNQSPWNPEDMPDGKLTNYSGGVSLLHYLDNGRGSYIISSAGVSQDNTTSMRISDTKVFLPGKEILVHNVGSMLREDLRANSITRLHLEKDRSFHEAWLDFTYSSQMENGYDDLNLCNKKDSIIRLQRQRDIFSRNYFLNTGYDGGYRIGRGIFRWGARFRYDNSKSKDNIFYSFSRPLLLGSTTYRDNFWDIPMQTVKGSLTFGYDIGTLGILDRIRVDYLYDCQWESVDSTLRTMNGAVMERDTVNSYNSSVLTGRHNLTFNAKTNLESLLGVPVSATLNLPLSFVSREMDYRRLRQNNYRRTDILCEPSLELEYSGLHVFKLNIDLLSTLPPMLYCTPFRNTSNPLHVLMGNTELENAYNLLLKFTHERTTSASAYYKTVVEYRRTYNALGKNVHFDGHTGVFTSMPVNVEGNWGLSGDFWVNTHLGNKSNRFSLENHLRAQYDHGIDLTAHEGMENSTRNTTHTVAMTNDIIVCYRPSTKWDMRVLLSTTWMHVKSDIPDFTNISTIDISYGLRLQSALPWQIHMGTTFLVNTTRGYESKVLNGDRFIWNAQISRAFFKDRIIIAIKGYDMLAQLRNAYHSVTPMSSTEISTNVVPRSFMLTLTWRVH